MSRFLLFLGLFLTITVVKAQDEFSYGIRYNNTTNTFDAYVVLTKGNTINTPNLTSNYARFTIVLPADSELSIVQAHNPILGNGQPESWVLGDVINKPKARPSLSFHEIELLGIGLGNYPALTLNEPVKLFSAKVTLGGGCIGDIRMFNNNTDPSEGSPGMKAKDFKNSFSIGSNTNIYKANVQLENFNVIKNEILTCPNDLVNYVLMPSSSIGDGYWHIVSSNTTFRLDSLAEGRAILNADAGNDVKSILAVYNEGNGNEFVCLTIPAQKPITAIDTICLGDTTRIATNGSGTWTSNNTAVATISPEGKITGVSTGWTTFTFTSAIGCVAVESQPLVVGSTIDIEIYASKRLCSNGFVILAAESKNASNYFLWSNGTTTPSIVVATPGLISVTVSSSGGCSATKTYEVLKDSFPIVTLEKTSICIGSAITASANPGQGFWSSSNPNVASFNSLTGLVTGIAQGQSSIIFTSASTGCSNGVNLIVNPPPTVAVSRDTICVGQSTSLSPVFGGSWDVLSPSIATLTNGGIVTGVSPGIGRFRFVESNTGCQAFETVFVKPSPIGVISGPTFICIGGTTTLSPPTGGTWSSSNVTVATVSNIGLVTGISPGAATFTFTEAATGCVSVPTGILTVNNKPVVSLEGNPFICLYSTRQLSPSTGGTWTSNNTAVATVTPSGLVTAVGIGVANFTFVQSGSQCNATTNNMIVNPNPFVSINKDTVCVGGTAIITPSASGSWFANTPTKASVSNTGVVTGITEGNAIIVFTETSTGCQAYDTLYIKSGPETSVDGLAIICPGKTAVLLPNIGGTWISQNPVVATVHPNTGIVIGIAQGTASFSRTDNATGCISDPVTITVLNKITTSSTTGQYMCVGGAINLMPNIGGTWTSNAPAVAIVSVNGLVNGLSGGTVAFEFNASNGCPSDPINMLVTDEKQKITFNGPSTICPGGFTQISHSFDKYLVLDKNIIDTFLGNGLIKGIAPGKARITLNPASGCTSDTVVVTVENFSSPTLVFDNFKTIENQDSVNILINGISGLIVPIEIIPIPNANIAGQKHRNTTSNILIDDVLVNLSSIPQLAQYIIKTTITGVPNQECHNIDTLHVWVRPSLDKYRVKFQAFEDENSDNVFNQNSETTLSGVLIRVDDLNLTQITDAVGQAIFLVDSSGSNYSATINYGTWQDSVIMSTIQSNDLESTIYLPFRKSNLKKQAVVTYSSNLLRCSTDIRSYASIINTGTAVISGQLVLIYNNRVKVNGANKPFVREGNNIIKWTVNQLTTGKSWNTEIGMTIPNANNNNDSLVFELFFVEANGDTLSSDRYAEIIRCSYDPNDKQSWPDRIGEDNLTLRTETLKYQIRFQNTGNDTAFVVRIQDVLDHHLDLNTLLITGSSHSVRPEIYGDTLQFIFDNIKLVDSTTNPLLSQGFVSFRIDEYRDIPNGTEIFNQVGIYFDKNDPIITNTVKNTIVNQLPCPLNAIWSVGDTLYVNGGQNVYTWYDCETDTIVSVSQNPFFKPETSGNYYAIIKGDFCSTTTACLVISHVKDSKAININLSPNPALTFISIVSEIPIDAYGIFNSLGRQVSFQRMQEESNQIEVSIDKLVSGVYYIECQVNGEKVILKFVKI